MLSKTLIKQIRSLRHKKYREAHSLFTVEGSKIIREIISSNLHISTIIGTQTGLKLLNSSKMNSEVIEVSDEEMRTISMFNSPSTSMALVKIPDYNAPIKLDAINIYFDELQDPGNMGTILRTMAWFGMENVYLSPNSVDAYNPKVVQASMGGVAHVKVHYLKLKEIAEMDVKSIWLCDMEGEDVRKVKPEEPTILVFGNEGKGLKQEYRKLTQNRLSIPGSGKIESLNVAMAAGMVISCIKKF